MCEEKPNDNHSICFQTHFWDVSQNVNGNINISHLKMVENFYLENSKFVLGFVLSLLPYYCYIIQKTKSIVTAIDNILLSLHPQNMNGFPVLFCSITFAVLDNKKQKNALPWNIFKSGKVRTILF